MAGINADGPRAQRTAPTASTQPTPTTGATQFSRENFAELRLLIGFRRWSSTARSIR